MNAVVTCKCGTKFKIPVTQTGTMITCPGCGKQATAPKLKTPPPPAPALQPEKPVAAVVKPREVAPPVIDEVEEIVDQIDAFDDDGAGYGIDANDGLAHLHDAGPGMWSTVAEIRLDEVAPCIAYGCKGSWALAGQGRDVLLVNMKEYKRSKSFEEHGDDVTAVALAASESIAISGDAEGTLLVWDVPGRKVRRTLKGHEGEIESVAITFDGARAASGGEDGLVNVFDLTTGKRLKLEYGDWSDDDEQITYVTFSRDGKKILAGGDEGRVCLWDAITGKRIKKFGRLNLPISCVRLSDEGGYVTATTFPVREGKRSFIVLSQRETATGESVHEIPLSVESIPCCVSPDQGGKRVFLGGGGEFPWLAAIDIDNGRVLHAYDMLRGAPICLAVAPHNNRVIASLDCGGIQVFGMTTF